MYILKMGLSKIGSIFRGEKNCLDRFFQLPEDVIKFEILPFFSIEEIFFGELRLVNKELNSWCNDRRICEILVRRNCPFDTFEDVGPLLVDDEGKNVDWQSGYKRLFNATVFCWKRSSQLIHRGYLPRTFENILEIMEGCYSDSDELRYQQSISEPSTIPGIFNDLFGMKLPRNLNEDTLVTIVETMSMSEYPYALLLIGLTFKSPVWRRKWDAQFNVIDMFVRSELRSGVVNSFKNVPWNIENDKLMKNVARRYAHGYPEHGRLTLANGKVIVCKGSYTIQDFVKGYMERRKRAPRKMIVQYIPTCPVG